MFAPSGPAALPLAIRGRPAISGPLISWRRRRLGPGGPPGLQNQRTGESRSAGSIPVRLRHLASDVPKHFVASVGERHPWRPIPAEFW